MVKSVVITTKTHQPIPLSQEIQNGKLKLDIPALETKIPRSFDLVITFQSAIKSFRNHDYTWVPVNQDRIAGELVPKIIQLENGFFVQPNLNQGFWEIYKTKPNVLFWRFNPEFSNPLTVYTGDRNERIVVEAQTHLPESFSLSLLFSKHNAIEFSRSPEPFLPAVCFTDHCDYDTLESLTKQRLFFKQHQVKVTKGFFLHHFSKRADNASYEKDQTELELWLAYGHELAYHSLSQSLKNKEEAFADFYSFNPPFEQCPTWIDHGYQPYNFSQYQNSKTDAVTFAENLSRKNIRILWNYIDSGTAALGVINQLNPNDFTLKQFSNGIRNMNFKTKISVLVKNILFHYYADEKKILRYKGLAGSFKKMLHQKKFSLFFEFMQNALSVFMPLFKVFFFWNYHKNIPYKLAKYTPIIFKHQLAGKDFYVFQTLEMIDFRAALHPQNMDKLILEKGLFIAHTYFSVPMEYHTGRIFKTPELVDEQVAENFEYLSAKIQNKEVWNPTIKELVDFLSTFESVVLDLDSEGKIMVLNSAGIPYRAIS